MLFRDPFHEFNEFTSSLPRQRQMLAMDAVRSDDEVTLYFDVPGVKPEEIDLTAERNEVTVEVQRRWFDADKKVLNRERAQGSFRRQIQVSDNLDTEHMKAKLDNGVLIISVPVAEKAKARKIQITGGSTQELTTSDA